jgi:hypothetical protein
MNETNVRDASDVQYVRATLVQPPASASARTSVESSRQRVVVTSRIDELVQLRFTPRNVRQSGPNAATH